MAVLEGITSTGKVQPVQVDTNGVVQTSATGGTSGTSNTGSAVPAAANYIAANVGGTLTGLVATANGLKVDASATTQPVSGTFWQATQPVSGTFWQATQPVSIATLPALVAGSAVIGHVIVDTAPSTAVTNAGTFATQSAQSGTWTVQPGNTPNSTPWLFTQLPATSGGLSMYSGSITTTVTAVKASAGQLYSMIIGNANTSAVYVQIFNLATGSVTLGTTAPTMSLYIPASSGIVLNDDNGFAFSTAISVACTTTRAGLTAPSSSVDLNFGYK